MIVYWFSSKSWNEIGVIIGLIGLNLIIYSFQQHRLNK